MPNFAAPNLIQMKKSLLIFVAALMMASCGEKPNQQQPEGQPNQETPEILIGAPIAPMRDIPLPDNNNGLDQNILGTSNGPVLRMEEGQPLDLSQLQGGGMSMGDRVASQIDSIRYKAEQGDASYQYAYGMCYEKGWGVDQSWKEALAWYTKAADQNNGPAFNALGNLYRMGSGVGASPKKAFEFYQKGAAEKDDQAMLNLGNCYFYGMGTEKDVEAAVRWWKDAAEAGNIYALSQMGDCYYHGLGVEKDLAKAVEYYSPAAERNVTSAQYTLGILYYTGEGVNQDRTYAKLLMRKASDGGMREATEFLERYFQE